MFHPVSVIIPVLVLAPNLAFFLARPVNVPSNQPKESLTFMALERLGQLGCFISPVFYPIGPFGVLEIVAAFGMGLTLSLYLIDNPGRS